MVRVSKSHEWPPFPRAHPPTPTGHSPTLTCSFPPLPAPPTPHPTPPARRTAKYEQWLNLTEELGVKAVELVRWEDMLTPQEQVGARRAGLDGGASPTY